MVIKSKLFGVIIGAIALAHCGLGQNQQFIFVGQFDECEGKDSGNYTAVVQETSNADCSQDSIGVGFSVLIQNGHHGEKTVIGLTGLAASRYPAGADVITENLFLFTSGSLAGKYGYIRAKHLLRNYLKKCSSILGYSFLSYKAELLISDKLNPNVLISPTGGYEAFKKGCTTICKGNFWGV